MYVRSVSVTILVSMVLLMTAAVRCQTPEVERHGYDSPQEAGDAFGILAVSILENDETLPRSVAPQQCGFPILLGPEDLVGKKLGLTHPPGACPLTNLFILDKQGRVIFRHHFSAVDPYSFRNAWRGER